MKVAVLQSNFTGGELSPAIAARVDIAKFANGVATCENFEPRIQGGAESRDGTAYITDALGNAKLAPFVRSRDSSYVLAFTNLHVSIYRTGDGSLVTTLETPYPFVDLPLVTYEQASDTMFLFSVGYYPRRLVRQTDTAWVFEPVPFINEPYDQATDPEQTFMFAESKDPVGSLTNLLGAVQRAATITFNATNATTATASAAVFSAGDVGKTIYADSGRFLISGYTSTTVVTGAIVGTVQFPGLSYQAGAWGITGAAFDPADVGKYVAADGTGGLFYVTAYADATRVVAEIRTAASALVVSPPGSWIIAGSSWTNANGFPRAGTLHEQRLWLGGTENAPLTIWGSRIAEYLNFEQGVKDDDAFNYALTFHQRNPIRHLAATRRLFVLTTGAEASLKGGNEKAIGATNVQKSTESSHGSNFVRPVEVDDELLFVQGAGRKVRAMGQSTVKDGYESPDRTVFADHITESGIVDMAYQAEPHSMLRCVRADGQMAVCAYNIEQEVTAWGRFVTDGFVRSVAVVPMATRDDVWLLVERKRLGSPVFTLERMDPDRQTDCGLLQTGTTSAIRTGLAHLEGRTVVAVADGTNQGEFTVAGGSITLPRSASVVEIGLPFTGSLLMLPPELGTRDGTAQGSNMSVHEVVVRVLETETLTINGQTTDFRKFGAGLLDQPPPEFTGDTREQLLTDNLYKPYLLIQRTKPYRAHVLSVVRKLTVNDK